MVFACSGLIAVKIACTCCANSRDADFGSAKASFGSGSDVQTIFVPSGLMRPAEIMALRLRS